MTPPCVAFGAFPLQGDATRGLAKPVPRWHRNGARQYLQAAGGVQGNWCLT